ncbi:MAG TPA: sigma-70 family RNA polymerase sigma factor [Kofleriaceae bacterium]|nr:sigma-70 family RNA polymerase sigma factor [Kofleriaceae bacterium]
MHPDPAVQGSPEPVLARVAAGDPESIRTCLERYGGLVYALARRYESAGSDVEDAVQEVFVDLWKSAGRFDPAIAGEATFVAMIARRRLIDRRRARDRRPTSELLAEPGTHVDPGAPPDVRAEAAQAARALDGLRPDQRRVLVLACHGMSHSEIAHETGLPLGTVKANVRRGLAAIRDALSDVPSKETS